MRNIRLRENTSGFALAATLIVLFAAPTMAATFTVGADPSCTHPTISDALFAAAFSAEADTIHLARNQPYTDEFVHLTNFGPGASGDLTIVGGYPTCDGTRLKHTEIDGRVGNSTLEIDTTGSNVSQVTLRGLRIVGSGIRGVKVEGNSTVFIEGSIIEGNGGGIDIEPGAFVSIDFFTTVVDNRGGSARVAASAVGVERCLAGWRPVRWQQFRRLDPH